MIVWLLAISSIVSIFVRSSLLSWVCEKHSCTGPELISAKAVPATIGAMIANMNAVGLNIRSRPFFLGPAGAAEACSSEHGD